jgi:ribonuclease P/MRP protein subunit RPP1
MYYCDLNLSLPSLQTSTSPSHLFNLITSSITDNYHILAVSTTRKGTIPNEPSLPQIYTHLTSSNIESIYKEHSIKFLNAIQPSLISFSNINILSRITIEISDQKELFQFTSPNNFLKQFDIIAVKPKNDKIFEMCLNSEINCDMICVDLDEKYSFNSKKHLICAAVEKGMFFEVNYAKFVVNNESRGVFISNFMLLNNILKGKNVVLSSQAESYFMHRSPFDVCTIFETVFDMKQHEVKQMICDNPMKVVLKAKQRKYFKNTVLVESNKNN